MARCQGAGIEPATIYKAVRRYPAAHGGYNYHAGMAECSICHRVISTRPNAEQATVMAHHGPTRTSQDARRRRLAETYLALSHPVRGAARSTYAGPVGQHITMTTGGSTSYVGSTAVTQGGQFNVQVTSATVSNGSHQFIINGTYYASQTGSMTIATDYVAWNAWNSTITTGTQAYITNNMTWQNWTTGIQVYQQNQVAAQARQQRPPAYATPRTREEQIAQAEALFQRVEAERHYTTVAAERALATLLELLTPEQREEYAEFNYFHVLGSKGRLYRILKGSSGNIRRVVHKKEQGRGQASFCVHSNTRTDERIAREAGIVAGHLPHEDHMIQQMLHLMFNEDEILAKANVHWGTREPLDVELAMLLEVEAANQADAPRMLEVVR